MSLSSFRVRRAAGFTLLELMIVIAIIAILASLLFVVVGGITQKRKKLLALKQVKEIEEAAKEYWRNWNEYPPDTGEYEVDDPAPQGMSAGDQKYAIHRYLGHKIQNPNTGEEHGPFLDIQAQFLTEGATVDGKYAQVFVDPWGNPYRMDCLHVPYDKATKKRGKASYPYSDSVPVEQRVIEVKIWSMGPDGKEGQKPSFYPEEKTPDDDDNVMSWAKSEK